MPTVIAYHKVKDKDHWLASTKREEFFGPLGVTNIRTFVDPTNPSRVAVLMDVADMAALTAAMQTAGAAEAMAFDGVSRDPGHPRRSLAPIIQRRAANFARRSSDGRAAVRIVPLSWRSRDHRLPQRRLCHN